MKKNNNFKDGILSGVFMGTRVALFAAIIVPFIGLENVKAFEHSTIDGQARVLVDTPEKVQADARAFGEKMKAISANSQLSFLEKQEQLSTVMKEKFLLTAICKSIVGREAWDSLSEQKQNEFMNQFADFSAGNFVANLGQATLLEFGQQNDSVSDTRVMALGVAGGDDTTVKIAIRYERKKAEARQTPEDNEYRIYDVYTEGISYFIKSMQRQYSQLVGEVSCSEVTKLNLFIDFMQCRIDDQFENAPACAAIIQSRGCKVE